MNEIHGGYIKTQRTPTDYIKGINSPLLGGTYNIDFRPYRPDFYPQSGNGFDSFGCVSWAAIQDIETLLNYKYANNLLSPYFKTFLETNGYIINGKIVCSKMFIAFLSGTTPSGNGFPNVANAVHKNGLIPDSMYPFNPQPGQTWGDIYKLLTQEMIDMGKKFLFFVNLGYHYLTDTNFSLHLQDGPIQIATPVCPGWSNTSPIAGCSLAESHSTMIDFILADNEKEVVDHYQPYIKLLSADYPIPDAMQYVVNEIPYKVEYFKYNEQFRQSNPDGSITVVTDEAVLNSLYFGNMPYKIIN